MQDFYNIDIISDILEIFKVNNVVISGIKDVNLINNILNYNALFTHINTNDENCILDNPLNALKKLENYDAIFIDDDPNWYTVFNELKIIKKTNKEFPLVFICNNNFPNKRRDSYLNPSNIPDKFRQKYSIELPISYNNKKIIITNGLYHACDENTPKNGVLTAIEDFLNDNSHIGIMKINFIKEISILYHKSQINQKRISIIYKNIQNQNLEDINLSDKLIENQLLISYINKYNLYNENLIDIEDKIYEQDLIITDYENKIRHQKNELNLKDSQIDGFESNLSLKDSEIKNIKSKLVNKNKKVNNLENQLETRTSDLNSLTQEIDNKDTKINNLEEQLESANNEFDFLSQKINDVADDFIKQESSYDNKINSLSNKYETELTKKIKIKENEILELKNDLTEKENDVILLHEELNHQKTINNAKDAKIKIQQDELNEEKKNLTSIEQSYIKNLSKLDNKEYCISCFKEEISNNKLEIEYFKNNRITKMILNPLAYLYLIFKSKPREISLNINLYRTLKDSECFDIGFYLNKNKDLINSKWCKYFSPELHYICNGFNEDRTFNKKYFNRNSKKELLEYLINCDE